MALQDALAKAMMYWGVIMRGVYNRVSTAELWQAIREQAGVERGQPIGFSASIVSRLRGIAARIRDFARQFSSDNPTGILDWTNVPVAPWARPVDERALNPQYHVRVLGDWLTPEGMKTGWKNFTLSNIQPSTYTDFVQMLRQQSVSNVASGRWINTPEILQAVHAIEVMEV